MTLPSGLVLPMDRIGEICRRYHVKELAVFGSQVRGDVQPDSDVDFLVEFEEQAAVGLIDGDLLQIRQSYHTMLRLENMVDDTGGPLSENRLRAAPGPVQKMARDALASGSPQNNPRVPSEKEIVQLYEQAW